MSTRMYNQSVTFLKDGESSSNYKLIYDYCEDFYTNRSSILHGLENDFTAVNFQATSAWIDDMLNNPIIHDEDYNILKFLNHENSLIFDIGANWGYSAGAFIKLGIKSKIFSFEAIPLFNDALNGIRTKFPNRFNYIISAVGSRPGFLTFVVPVLNGVAESGLCSASSSPQIQFLAKNILHSIEMGYIKGEKFTLQLFEFTTDVRTVDDIYEDYSLDCFQSVPLQAIKIDVEGLECDVLSGALKVLDKHKPLVLAEGANRTKGIQDLMTKQGYLFAEIKNDCLYLHDGLGMHANGFFLHHMRLDEYIELGILKK